MKLRNLLLGMLLCATAASAQDVITKTDGSKIDAKVEEVTDAVIRYRKASNPSGPIYTIPIASVTTIVYENGSVDQFNDMTESTDAQESQSDEELLRYAEAHNLLNTTPNNDTQLLKMAFGDTMTPEQLRKRAKTYRIIGWTGGITLVAASIIVPAAIWGGEWGFETQQYSIMTAGIVAGVGCCIGFNLWARSLMNQARELEYYSSTIIEDKILNLRDKSLMAGVNVMSNTMTRTQGIGLSLKLNF